MTSSTTFDVIGVEYRKIFRIIGFKLFVNLVDSKSTVIRVQKLQTLVLKIFIHEQINTRNTE